MTTVIVPACNEEPVIGRCLRSVYAATGRPDEVDVVVVLNGCTDATGEVARAVAPAARVLELREPGKARALRAGDAAAAHNPLVFLDADVTLGPGALDRLEQALATEEPRVAAPTLRLDLSSVPRHLVPYYRVWLRSPWHAHTLVGSGVYALNRAGRARFETFPDVVADDLFIHDLFAPHERIALPDVTFSVSPPRTVRSLTQVRRRVHAGNRELRALRGNAAAESGGGDRDWLRQVARDPGHWYGVALYTLVNLWARTPTRGHLRWAKDETARTVS